MNPLSIYTCVYIYIYIYLTAKALIEPHHIICVTLDIIVLMVRFGNRAHACRVAFENEFATLQQKFLGYLMNCLITMCQTMDYPYQRV